MINSESAKLVVQNLPPSVRIVSIPGDRVDNNFLIWLVNLLKF